MVKKIAAADLNSLLEGNSQFALIDVREAGEYNSTHIINSSLIPRRHLESQMSAAVPVKGCQVGICDDDGRRAGLAAET
ncbi:MAG: rhodanese-like domain-containing protein, partial [Dehalococcoidia bacterium]|nr:rhodanese-like domain-containing protein [Dehalococcoidia bacterium]